MGRPSPPGVATLLLQLELLMLLSTDKAWSHVSPPYVEPFRLLSESTITTGCQIGSEKFSTQTRALNEACCTKGVDCPGGVPHVCSASCALAFGLMDASGCAHMLDISLSMAGLGNQVDELRVNCGAVPYEQVVTAAHGRCDTLSAGIGHRRAQRQDHPHQLRRLEDGVTAAQLRANQIAALQDCDHLSSAPQG